MALNNRNKWIICRICLKSSSAEMTNIFSSIGLPISIENCGGIQLGASPNLPDKICSKCLMLLNISLKFRALCQKSQNQLNKYLGTQTACIDCIGKNVSDCICLDTLGKALTSGIVKEESHSYPESKQDDDMNCLELDNTKEHKENGELDKMYDDHNSYQVEFLEEDSCLQFTSDDMSSASNQPYDMIQSCKNELILSDNPYPHGPLPLPYEKIVCHKKNINFKRKSKKATEINTFEKIKEDKIETKFMCFKCGNMYKDKTKLTAHLKSHNNVKPHECEICHKQFAQTPQLARHMNSHTGERPFKCKFCTSRFADPSTCIKHQRIHTNERPYTCGTCGKTFAYSNVLKVHLMTHTGEKPYCCEYCGWKFTQLHHKRNHERKHK